MVMLEKKDTWLLSSKGRDDLSHLYAAADRGCLAVRVDTYVVQLVHVDLDVALNSGEAIHGAMATSVSEEWSTMGVGVLDLHLRVSTRGDR